MTSVVAPTLFLFSCDQLNPLENFPRGQDWRTIHASDGKATSSIRPSSGIG